MVFDLAQANQMWALVGFGSVGAAPVEGEDGNMDSAEVVVGVQYIYQGC